MKKRNFLWLILILLFYLTFSKFVFALDIGEIEQLVLEEINKARTVRGLQPIVSLSNIYSKIDITKITSLYGFADEVKKNLGVVFDEGYYIASILYKVVSFPAGSLSPLSISQNLPQEIFDPNYNYILVKAFPYNGYTSIYFALINIPVKFLETPKQISYGTTARLTFILQNNFYPKDALRVFMIFPDKSAVMVYNDGRFSEGQGLLVPVWNNTNTFYIDFKFNKGVGTYKIMFGTASRIFSINDGLKVEVIGTPSTASITIDTNYLYRIFRDMEKHIFYYTNEERKRYGLEALEWDEGLAKASRYHSKNMATRNFFSHNDPYEGTYAQDRVRKLYTEFIGGVGENIYYTEVYLNVEDLTNTSVIDAQKLGWKAVDAWMHSPPHRKNILNPPYNYLGVGVDAYYKILPGEVLYLKIYATQNFGEAIALYLGTNYTFSPNVPQTLKFKFIGSKNIDNLFIVLRSPGGKEEVLKPSNIVNQGGAITFDLNITFPAVGVYQLFMGYNNQYIVNPFFITVK